MFSSFYLTFTWIKSNKNLALFKKYYNRLFTQAQDELGTLVPQTRPSAIFVHWCYCYNVFFERRVCLYLSTPGGAGVVVFGLVLFKK